VTRPEQSVVQSDAQLTLAEDLRLLAELLPRVLHALADQCSARPALATAKHNPCSSAKQFKRICASGAVPLTKLGKAVAVPWTALEEHLRAQARLPAPAPEQRLEELKSYLTRLGGGKGASR
jgi:hypothetical protein